MADPAAPHNLAIDFWGKLDLSQLDKRPALIVSRTDVMWERTLLLNKEQQAGTLLGPNHRPTDPVLGDVVFAGQQSFGINVSVLHLSVLAAERLAEEVSDFLRAYCPLLAPEMGLEFLGLRSVMAPGRVDELPGHPSP